MTDPAGTEGQILELERRRCAALMAGDIAALGELVSDDLVHIHGNGAADDRAGYLKGVADKYRFHDVRRGDLTVRAYGDWAVVTGRLTQTIVVVGSEERHAIEAMTTQTWVRDGDGWRQNTCHNAFLNRA